MTKRIFGSIFGVALVTLLIGFLFTVFTVQNKTEAETKAHAEAFCNTLAASIEKYGTDAIVYEGDARCHIMLVDQNNQTLYDSYGEPVAFNLVTCQKELTNGWTLSITFEQPSTMEVLYDLLAPFSVAFGVFLILALLLSIGLSKSIVNPIADIDLKHPEESNVYSELKPLVHKIEIQNQTIRSQMLDLFQQQQKFDTIADNMTEGMLIVNREGKVVSFNGAASGILSLSLEHKGQDIAPLSPTPAFLAVVNEALEGKHPQQLIPIFERTYQVIGNPIRVKEELMGAVLALLDVTEREERDRLRQEFSANVSHELKTPLTSISGFAEIMKNGLVKPQDMSGFASRIYDEAQRLILLIGDIIQLSRLEENNLSAQIQQVDLYEIAKEIQNRLQHQADKNHIELRLQGSSCQVKGVPHILDEMIYNLCDNAIKYNREKGSVTLTVLPREEDIMVAVADTGIGIPYEEQERVFERFYRIDKSHSKEIGGTGLGLSIVKHGAAFHNASVQLESVPGEGTCITLLFPKCQ